MLQGTKCVDQHLISVHQELILKINKRYNWHGPGTSVPVLTYGKEHRYAAAILPPRDWPRMWEEGGGLHDLQCWITKELDSIEWDTSIRVGHRSTSWKKPCSCW